MKKLKMKYFLIFGIMLPLFLSCTAQSGDSTSEYCRNDTILRIEMFLDAFGVEADFPLIKATIDFEKDSVKCYKWYYNPELGDSTYTLTISERKRILELLNKTKLEDLKTKYSVDIVDQPRSTTKIMTTTDNFEIDDYGLKGDYPLKELYKIVYKY
jgi:hypothetical protein